MNRYHLAALLLSVALLGCSDEGTAPATKRPNSVIVEGTITYDSITVSPVGSAPPPVGFYLINRHWMTQITDTGSFVYLSGSLDSARINKRAWIEGTYIFRQLPSILAPIRYMDLQIDSLRLLQ